MLPVDEIRLNFNPASLVVLNGVLGFLMFGIALDTRVADFKRVLRMPGAMAVGIAAQFIVLPAVTFVLTLLLKPGPSIALGMILVACCPPGNVSNILTHRAGGQCGAVGVDDGHLQRAGHRAHAAQLRVLGRHAPHGGAAAAQHCA